MSEIARQQAQDIWWHGVNAVRGTEAVKRALLAEQVARPDHIIAVGKAACAMAAGAFEVFGGDIPALVVTKYDHAEPLPPSARIIEAAHPVPDENSLIAGHALLAAVRDLPEEAHLLVLVSGGASALAELPEDGLSLAALQTENTRLLSQGLDIHAMNARRKELSQIKGGKLLANFNGALVTTLAISDVEGDALSVIGSGIGDAPEFYRFSFDPFIVASNGIARAAAAEKATGLGLNVLSDKETLYADVFALAEEIGHYLRDAPSGVHIWGGEPTVVLPPDPGQGGRNQALALALAREVSGVVGLTVLVAGTDGTDGPTAAAGGIITGATWREDGDRYLRQADSGRFLEQHGALFTSGPTGTNVMDLVIAIRD
ncbi:DUF4147 domain-containing protein [Shimia sp. CNT1-13L.2]|uniref:glycerate kinase type-2 family protein n=1 Tax=Shimia sp. CNT1-13L.2 TaxID=2959663 RepID=UPI0020CE0616|nr:DUF4147 domain-containing protein [Shimia sp. CNT1-13L.2]MCP9481731.1 DUF4147 domain-containing protein [Shimia sp. CNT1-13L.2]